MTMEKSLNELLRDAEKRTRRKRIIIGILLILAGILIFSCLTASLYIDCLDSWQRELKWKYTYESFWDFFLSKDGTIAVFGFLGAIPVIAGILTLTLSDHKLIYDPQ